MPNPYESLVLDDNESESESDSGKPLIIYQRSTNRQGPERANNPYLAPQTRGERGSPAAVSRSFRRPQQDNAAVTIQPHSKQEDSTGECSNEDPLAYHGVPAPHSSRGPSTNWRGETRRPSTHAKVNSKSQRDELSAPRAQNQIGSRSSTSRQLARAGAHPNVFGEPKAPAIGGFPRVIPMNNAISTQKEDQRRLKEVVHDSIIVLRQKPEDEDLLRTVGVFLWPSEDMGVEPMRADDSRLDTIRKRQQCHMIMVPNPKRLCIYGTDPTTAEQVIGGALEAVRTIIHESLLRAARCVRFILANPPKYVEWPPNIHLTTAQTQNTASSRAARIEDSKFRVAIAEPPMVAYHDKFAEVSHNLRKNTLTLEMALRKGLDRLLSSPGRVEVKALIGCFVFNRIANPPKGLESMPISMFLEKLRDTKSQGHLLRLSPEGDLFGRLLARNDLFMAFDDGKPCDLEAIKPTFVGVWTFGSNGTSDMVDRQLSVETCTRNNEDGTPHITRRDWTSPYEHPNSRRLEAFIADLEGGLSWKLEAVAHPYCRNIGDELQRFQARISTKQVTSASDPPGSTELMFTFPFGAGQKDFYQRTQWKFSAKSNRHLIFQITRLDRFNLLTIEPRGSAFSDAQRRRPASTEWEACIYDARWNEVLGQNGTLGLGESAAWDSSISRFFPSLPMEGSNQGSAKNGFAKFVDCVTEICDGLSTAKPW